MKHRMNKKITYSPRSEASHLLGFTPKHDEQNIDNEGNDGDSGLKRYIWDKKGLAGVRMKTIQKPKGNLNIKTPLKGENYDKTLEKDSTVVMDNNNTIEDNGKTCAQVPADEGIAEQEVFENNNSIKLHTPDNKDTDDIIMSEYNTAPLPVLEVLETGNLQVSENEDLSVMQVSKNKDIEELQMSENDTVLLQVPVNHGIIAWQGNKTDGIGETQMPKNKGIVSLSLVKKDDFADIQPTIEGIAQHTPEPGNLADIAVVEEDCTAEQISGDNTAQLQSLKVDTSCMEGIEEDNAASSQIAEVRGTNQMQTQNNNMSQDSNLCSKEDKQEFSIVMPNVPKPNNLELTNEYKQSECGPIQGIELANTEGLDGQNVTVERSTQQQLNESKTILNNKPIEGLKFVSEEECFIDDDSSDLDNRMDEVFDIWDFDPDGLYGLKLEFLESLNIKPPINAWVHVTNFRCEKSELRDAMEIAGRVLFCTVISVYTKYAKVMYSHPLEAVQAVSMLDGQKFYGDTLSVTMDARASKIIVLPKGLKRLGPGLGRKGKVITNVAKHYERHIKNQSHLIDPKIFAKVNNINTKPPEELVEESQVVNDRDTEDESNNKNLESGNIQKEENQSDNKMDINDVTINQAPLALHAPIMSVPVRVTTPCVRPQVPRRVYPKRVSMANLPPAMIRNYLLYSSYNNFLLRPKVRTPVLSRYLRRNKSSGNDDSSEFLPSIPEVCELDLCECSPASEVQELAGSGLSGPRPIEANIPRSDSLQSELSGDTAIEIRSPSPSFSGPGFSASICTGLSPSVFRAFEPEFHGSTVTANHTSRVCDPEITGSTSNRYSSHVTSGPGPLRQSTSPGQRPGVFVTGSIEYFPHGSSRLPGPNSFESNIPGTSLLQIKVSESIAHEYQNSAVLYQSPGTSFVEYSSGPGLLKPVLSVVSSNECMYPGQALPPEPCPLVPIYSQPTLPDSVHTVAPIEYIQNVNATRSPGMCSFESIAPGRCIFETGFTEQPTPLILGPPEPRTSEPNVEPRLEIPPSIGYARPVTNAVEPVYPEIASTQLEAPVPTYGPGYTGTGSLMLNTSGSSLESEVSEAGPLAYRPPRPIRPPGRRLPKIPVIDPSRRVKSGSFQPHTAGSSCLCRSRTSQFSGTPPIWSEYQDQTSVNLSQDLMSQVYGPPVYSFYMDERYEPVRVTAPVSECYVPCPHFDIENFSNINNRPVRYICIPDVTGNLRQNNDNLRMLPTEPMPSNSGLLSNLPPNTTLQMLCDNVDQYQEHFSMDEE